MRIAVILATISTTIMLGQFHPSAAAPHQQQEAVCTGVLDTGSGMAGSTLGNCSLPPDSASEHAVQNACKQGVRCEVRAMVTMSRNGTMQVQRVISAIEIPTRTFNEAGLMQKIAGQYTYAARGYTGRMVISIQSVCEVANELSCLNRTVLKLSLMTGRMNGNNATCQIDAIEQPAARVIGPASQFVFADESRRIIEITIDSKQGLFKAEVRGSEDNNCGAGGAFAGIWTPDKAHTTQLSPMATVNPRSAAPNLENIELELSAYEGRWSDGKCASKWSDVSVTRSDVIFRDQLGRTDVERVVSVEAGGFQTRSVLSSRGSTGGLWKYELVATDVIRVQNLSIGSKFDLHRCLPNPPAARLKETSAEQASIPTPQSPSVIQRTAPLKVASFTVIINFSPKARQRMIDLGEYLTIHAYFYGEPSEQGENLADYTGRIQVGEAFQTMPMKSYASATFSGSNIDLTKIAFLKDNEPFVRVNVYSADRVVIGNLLDCDTFEEPVMVAARGPVTLVCRLAGED